MIMLEPYFTEPPQGHLKEVLERGDDDYIHLEWVEPDLSTSDPDDRDRRLHDRMGSSLAGKTGRGSSGLEKRRRCISTV